MIIAAVVTLLATFYFGFSVGKRLITKGLTLRALQLIGEGDKELSNAILRLLKEKEVG